MGGKMVLDRGKFNRDYCAAGEKRFQELDPEGFKPIKLSRSINGKQVAICHKCDQTTTVKKNGFFVKHKASVKGYKGMQDKRSGTPARVRGRQTLA